MKPRQEMIQIARMLKKKYPDRHSTVEARASVYGHVDNVDWEYRLYINNIISKEFESLSGIKAYLEHLDIDKKGDPDEQDDQEAA